MKATFKPLIALFLSCFILFLGNGLINVLLPVRMGLNAVSTDAIGLVLSLYFVGMFIGALYSKTLIKRAGHIRMFAGCVSLGAISILMCSIFDDSLVWGAMRIVLGFCNACAFSAMESWLSDSSTKQTRGQILGAYNAVVLAGLFGGQFFMNIANPADTTLFVIGGMLLCAAVIPVSLSRNPGPVIEEVQPMSLLALYKVSPLGVVSCLIAGLIYSALFNLLPVFAKDFGITGLQLSIYMGGAISGAFLLQFPIGYFSDHFDRRIILLILLVVSTVTAYFVTVFAASHSFAVTLGFTALTSGIIACLYPLSISQVFDQLEPNEMVSAMGSLILAFATGGILGPYSASLVMDYFDSAALFYFLCVIQLLLALFVAYRMTIREALPVEDQESFVMQHAVINPSANLDPRTQYEADEDSEDSGESVTQEPVTQQH